MLELTKFQEYAPANAVIDYSEILAVDLETTGPDGTFQNVVKTFEGRKPEDSLRKYKYYAPGVGMLRVC